MPNAKKAGTIQKPSRREFLLAALGMGAATGGYLWMRRRSLEWQRRTQRLADVFSRDPLLGLQQYAPGLRMETHISALYDLSLESKVPLEKAVLAIRSNELTMRGFASIERDRQAKYREWQDFKGKDSRKAKAISEAAEKRYFECDWMKDALRRALSSKHRQRITEAKRLMGGHDSNLSRIRAIVEINSKPQGKVK